MFDLFSPVFLLILRAWQSGNPRVRFVIGVVLALFAAAMTGGVLGRINHVDENIVFFYVISLAGAGSVLLVAIGAHQTIEDEKAKALKLDAVEERAREHPEKPQLAWDLARTKLESYLDRNLSQVRSIYWLTLLVMLFGFGFVMYGLFQASQDSAKLPVSLIAAAAGVIISFIGGSFLLVFRSILAESRGYVTVLERINAVGMAVQVIANTPDSNADLKHATTANLAKQLLNLYARTPAEIEPVAPSGKDSAQ
ncbi:TRADD-N-associated membrane domain-containing protein [Variovorax sp. GB1P17]|uniref:TRADD-N-associated membrane domain-containing protein n=1 Tax=Variovorax sp. GB1P17 TaxID=3443740 RepID=UPI003F46A305